MDHKGMMTFKKLVRAAIVGAGATAVMDLGGEVIRRATGVRPLNLDLVGRWVGHLRRGTLTHDSIVAAEPIENERELGLATHYAIGAGFVMALAVVDSDWIDEPRLGSAMGLGLATCAAPWFLMQPAWGMGVAASRTPDPNTARRRTMRAHLLYGLGAYLMGKGCVGCGGTDLAVKTT